jgi:transposase InsO family protein
VTKRDDWQDDDTQLEAKGLPPARPDDPPLVYLDETGEEAFFVEDEEPAFKPPRLIGGGRRKRGRSRSKAPATPARKTYTGEERFLILDTWLRSKLPAKDFAPLVGVSKHSLYAWKKRFETDGPAGLEDSPRRRTGSGLSEATKRAILLLKETHPEWGEDRIHDVLRRSEGLSASPRTIGRVLADAGYEVTEVFQRRHPDKKRRFERARPNELWQTDLFTFTLKRQNRRVHLVAYLDDHSRFIVGYGLHASASGALVREVFEAAIASYGAPIEILTDNGSQYVTWRGKSAFSKLCERRGIKQVVARPRRPQTLGKIERFWGSLWRECLEGAVFLDMEDARARLGHFMDHYNFHRTHQGIGGLVPADRFFAASGEVKTTLRARVASNALELAQHGLPRKPFYLTGKVGDVGISLHAEGEKVVLVHEDGKREAVDLRAPGRRAETGTETPAALPAAQAPDGSPPDAAAIREDREPPAPGGSALDDFLDAISDAGPRAGGAL